MSDTAAADIARAEDLAERALAARRASSVARFAKAQVLRAQDRYEEAIPRIRDRHSAQPQLGPRILASRVVQVRDRVDRGAYPDPGTKPFGSVPRDPQIGLFYFRIGFAHLLQSRPDEAIVWCEKARNATPAHPFFRILLAFCLCSQW